jgi:hypothetical protein
MQQHYKLASYSGIVQGFRNELSMSLGAAYYTSNGNTVDYAPVFGNYDCLSCYTHLSVV